VAAGPTYIPLGMSTALQVLDAVPGTLGDWYWPRRDSLLDISEPWQSLVSFRPATSVQSAFLSGRVRDEFYFQKIEDGASPGMNADNYSVLIERFPFGYSTPEQFFELFRIHFFELNTHGIADVKPYDDDVDGPRWNSTDPTQVVGTILSWAGPVNAITRRLFADQASVLVSDATPTSLTVTTVHTKKDAGHPASGQRRWAIAERENGWLWTNVGVDRATDNLPRRLTAREFQLARDSVWAPLQTSVVNFVNERNGKARITAQFRTTLEWQTIQREWFKPSVEWMPDSGSPN